MTDVARGVIERRKGVVRDRVWDTLVAEGVAGFPGAHGRIPNFSGAGRAAERLAGLEAWRSAAHLKANPDMPQLPVRTRALADEIVVYLAVPRLAAEQPFLALDPTTLEVEPRRAASIKGSSRHGVPIGVEDLPHLDLVVCGTVAVNPAGVRIGKGGGYSDLEFALGREAGGIDDATIIVTTVHDLQVLDEDLPEADHDFRVDLVVTPTRTLVCPGGHRPPGILWDRLDAERVGSMPALARRRGR